MIARTLVFLAAFTARLALAKEACVAPPPPPPPPPHTTHCPTITATGKICGTCSRPACAVLSTISRDCPATLPTVTLDFNCGERGCSTGCETFYVRPTTTLVTTTASPTLAASCTFKPTQTIWAKSGCELGCDSTLLCIWDAAVTLPCGCTSVKVQPTTTTMCPTSPGCVQCTTGWGIVTVTESNCGGKPKPTATKL